MSANLYRDINLRDQALRAALKVIDVLQSEVSDPALAERLMAEGNEAMADLEMFKRELGI